jgi:hypothetical protein
MWKEGKSCCRSRADVPQLNAHHLELLAVIAQRLVTKCRAGIRYAVLKIIVKPQPIMTIAVLC